MLITHTLQELLKLLEVACTLLLKELALSLTSPMSQQTTPMLLKLLLTNNQSLLQSKLTQVLSNITPLVLLLEHHAELPLITVLWLSDTELKTVMIISLSKTPGLPAGVMMVTSKSVPIMFAVSSKWPLMLPCEHELI